jgi:hypothetical protein
MADIKDQLIKDSYNYVLQSDLSTGIVYRIGGSIPVNPKFLSGLTINSGFTYSNGTEQNGYALLTDGTGYAYWGPVSGSSSGLTYYVQSTLPPGSGYTNGDRWFDTSTGDELVWIIDSPPLPGTWVQPNNGGGGGGSPYSGSGISNFLTIWNSTYGLTASTIQYDGTQYIIPQISATTINSQNYQGNLVTSITNGDYISITNSIGDITISNTKPDVDVEFNIQDGVSVTGTYPIFNITNEDKGSSQNIFKNIQIDGNTQFSAGSNTDNLNFSGIGITITSGTNNTLIFSAGTSSQPVSGDYLPLSGGTLTGGLIANIGITANTISATTYYNLPVSGLTSGTGISVTNNNNNFTIAYTGSTGITGEYLPLSGGTVTGGTIFQSGLTTNTISATTYFNLPVSGLTSGTGIGLSNSNGNYTISYTGSSGGGLQYFVSASTPTVTINSGDRWFNTNTGVELVWVNDGDSQQWVQPFSVPGPLSPDVGYYTTTGITTGQTLTWDKTYWGISGNSNVNLILPPTTSKEGYYLIIKDEAGICGTYRIRITPASGTIDGNNYVDMNINYMSLTCIVRGGNWYLI